MSQDKKRLGRGLDTLIPRRGLDKLLPQNEARPEDDLAEPSGRPLLVDQHLIDLNPDQPRREFNENELASLARSIKAKGIIEPLVVTAKDNGRYELIAGERRLKAAQLIHMAKIPVIIREKSEDPADRLILALLENLCRADLNPIEEAASFARLEKEFNKTHQEIAILTGRERPSVTNAVRLLKLPDNLQDDIRFHRLSAGHGRALLGLTDPSLIQTARGEVLAKSLTVRQTENLVRRLNRNKATHKSGLEDQAYYEALANRFTSRLNGLKVKITPSGRGCKMEIFYSRPEELEWLMQKIGVEPV